VPQDGFFGSISKKFFGRLADSDTELPDANTAELPSDVKDLLATVRLLPALTGIPKPQRPPPSLPLSARLIVLQLESETLVRALLTGVGARDYFVTRKFKTYHNCFTGIPPLSRHLSLPLSFILLFLRHRFSPRFVLAQLLAGADACNWMERNLSIPRAASVSFCQRLLEEGYFVHVPDEKPFSDSSSHYYSFTVRKYIHTFVKT
jgi:hypothetical protein